MRYLVVIALLAFGAAVIISIVSESLKAVAKGTEATKYGLFSWIGRKRFGVKAYIPHELVDKLKESKQSSRGDRYKTLTGPRESPTLLPFMSYDTDAANLRAYMPKAEISRPPSPLVFNGIIEQVFKSAISEPSPAIRIDRIAGLLDVELSPPYVALFAPLGTPPVYPVAPPGEPPQISAPPSWSPWQPELAEPSFKPPHYSFGFSFLNRFVDAAYLVETEKVKAASALRDDLLARCAKRNAEVAAMAGKAMRVSPKTRPKGMRFSGKIQP